MRTMVHLKPRPVGFEGLSWCGFKAEGIGQVLGRDIICDKEGAWNS